MAVFAGVDAARGVGLLFAEPSASTDSPFHHNPRLGSLLGAQRPRHARSIVRNAKSSARIDDDDSAMAIQPRLQVVQRLLRGLLRRRPALHAIRGPLASTSFIIGSPHPVVETAALRLSA